MRRLLLGLMALAHTPLLASDEPPPGPRLVFKGGVGIPNLVWASAATYVRPRLDLELTGGWGLLPASVGLGAHYHPLRGAPLTPAKSQIDVGLGVDVFVFRPQSPELLIPLSGEVSVLRPLTGSVGLTAGLRLGVGPALGIYIGDDGHSFRFEPGLLGVGWVGLYL